MIQRKSRKISS